MNTAQTVFQSFLNGDTIYTPGEIGKVLDLISPYLTISRSNKKTSYYNIPCSFDIETTSFFRTSGNCEQEKVGIMYEWTLGLFGLVIIGRTWPEYVNTIERIACALGVDNETRLCIYVHNLAYEFQFMRKWFEWSKVFSLENRKVIYAIDSNGVEYRCSYLLSGYSLEKVGENLTDYNVRKLAGELDYSKLRHSYTPLTQNELAYCVNDVKVVMAYIAEAIRRNGGLAYIPLTKTGYVRRFCKNMCFIDNANADNPYKGIRYLEVMRRLKLAPDEYQQLKAAFQGGFTHANPFYSGKVLSNITSFDFTSSYPTVMIAERFPMGAGELVNVTNKDEFEYNIKHYCCLFDVEFYELKSQLWQDSYFSQSRCVVLKNAVTNNGRIVQADYLRTTITEQDFLIVRKFYTWGKMGVRRFRRYRKGYLPTDFVKAILKLYSDKTTLKGVEGKEVEYMQSKEMLNSCYGMCVTDIVRDEVLYTNNEWQDPEPPNMENAINKYNHNPGRFLFYPWGVWVTAYARRNLFAGIVEFGTDYVYSDTDSIKVKNADKHEKFISEYNERIRQQLYRAMDFHGISRDAIEPMTKDGVKKCLGVWDFDGNYEKFKTLGAKRYLVKYSSDPRNKAKDRGKISLTVSGLNKSVCVPWMVKKWGEENVFEHFDSELYVPAEYTGKLTHTYIDEPRKGLLIDYLGNCGEYSENSCIHLGPADYTLSISREYSDFLANIQDI